jgi:prepilin-type N-terminal cleavage/methylation domain-containing protein
MKRMPKTRIQTQRGFSLLEILVVVSIMLLMSAIAVPKVMQSIQAYRLNVAATSLQNIIEVTRFNAVRRNTQIMLRQTTLSGRTMFYVDLAGTGNYVNTDPGYLLPEDMQLAPAAAPAASTTGLTSTSALGTTGCIGFDHRGIVNYATCGAGTPVVWFISVGQSNPSSGFRAVTVTTMGQAKAWTAASGGSWNTM